ncbi:MAG: CHC2 zinc finger domain-containing protein [Patescibacteria group bacterium]
MPTPVEQIKSRLSIVDVIGSYIRLTKAGGSYKALCPFHNEKTPSFNVSPSRDAYYCFGCNRGGDIFTFVEEIEGLDFPGALRVLADRAGVELKHENMEAKSERERLLSIMEDAANFYEEHLAKNSALPTGQAGAKEYLIGRGLKEKTIRSFRIGFAPLDWRLAYNHLKSKGYLDNEIERAGLTKKVESKGYYDRFRGRIMFPIFDISGRVVAFSGRVFGHQSNQAKTAVSGGSPDHSSGMNGLAEYEPAKYINSPETPLYDKSSVLFGYDRAKVAIRKQNFAILVEGQMDLIMAQQAGTENAVAVSGTALTERHLTLLKRLTDNLVFAFDVDEAGLKTNARAFRLALAQGLTVLVASVPNGKDPADYIKENPEGWSQIIANPKHVVEAYLNVLATLGHDKERFRKEVEREVMPLVSLIPNRLSQELFLDKVARPFADHPSSIAAVRDELAKHLNVNNAIISLAKPSIENTKSTPAKSRRQLAEEEIVGILLWQGSHKDPAFDVMAVRASYEGRVSDYGLMPYIPEENEARNLIIRAEHTYTHGPKLSESLDEMLDTLEREVLKEKQADLMKKIIDAKLRGSEDEENDYLRQFQAITPRLVLLEDSRMKHGKGYL